MQVIFLKTDFAVERRIFFFYKTGSSFVIFNFLITKYNIILYYRVFSKYPTKKKFVILLILFCVSRKKEAYIVKQKTAVLKHTLVISGLCELFYENVDMPFHLQFVLTN